MLQLLGSTKEHESITPVLKSAHWLSVCLRTDFKILLLTFKVLNGRDPSDLLNIHTPLRELWSTSQFHLDVSGSKLKCKDD